MSQDKTKQGMSQVADVLLFLPLAKTYSYLIPEAFLNKVARGVQVSCPVRGRERHGVVMKVRDARVDDPVLQPINSVITARPPWPEDLISLIEWMGSYYIAPVGLAARTAMPSYFVTHPPKPSKYLRLADRPTRSIRSEKAHFIIEKIEEAGMMEIAQARSLCQNASSVIRRLLAAGILKIEEVLEVTQKKPPHITSQQIDIVLTEHQTSALNRIYADLDKGFTTFLLHGVTGSGKTEVYLRVIDKVVKGGKGAIILVPEIALTVELEKRFENQFPGLVTILHSGIPTGRRAHIWDSILRGEIKVVVGARSAIFAPVHNLGVIVVDEEHDPSYKQNEGLHYHGRDVAIMRAKKAQCPIILGSATPSIESFQNAHNGKYVYISMPKRVEERKLPEVRFVDLRYEKTVEGDMFSKPLLNALEETISRNETAILYLNRRGFGRFQLCEVCGQQIECPNCSITLTHHMKPERLVCHYCDYTTSVPYSCPKCGASEMKIIGFGTERVEEEVARIVKGARCARLDADATRSQGFDKILNAFRKGEINVLVGTQIITKGHDFPMVTLVGVLFAEQSLAFPDFRASERTFQILTQVAGRSGRGDSPGKVIIQTYRPDHYSLRYVATHDFTGFIVTENQIRQARGYPPHSHLATIEVSGQDSHEVQSYAQHIKDMLSQFLMLDGAGSYVVILGPSYAAIEKLRGKFRMQILLKSPSRKTLNRILWRLFNIVGRGKKGIKVDIDVDPIMLL